MLLLSEEAMGEEAYYSIIDTAPILGTLPKVYELVHSISMLSHYGLTLYVSVFINSLT